MTTEERRAREKAYREENKERINANQRYNRARNPEKYRERDRAYYHSHKAQRKAITEKWRKANKEHINAYCRKRRLEKKLANE